MMDCERFAPWISDETRAHFRDEFGSRSTPPSGIAALRLHYDAFNRRHLEVALATYPVDIAHGQLGGVSVNVVTPKGAVGQRMLLCLHGGGFMWGRGAGALLEAVPIAATSGMRVIAVEYALAPEQVFPAAVDDVVAVYQAACAERPATQIGIYGCSAGAVLTAQATARVLADGLPVPGAIAMLCGAGLEMAGDSTITAAALTGQPEPPSFVALPYFAQADLADPLVLPGNHAGVLARFPPSLLVTGTRDFAASSVTVMHRRLVAAGADASLLHFDGMWHAFHMATGLPEARETFAVMAGFFEKHLA